MNKRMREILSKIEELRGAAKVFRDEKKFDDAQQKLDEIKELQKEYEIEKALFEAEQSSVPENPPASAPAEPTQEEKDEKTFKDFIIGTIASMKAGEQNLGGSNTSSIIPVTIANRIISKVKEISPIYSRATIFHVKGTLKIPVWSDANTSHNINVAYAEEFTELTADSGKFTSIDLGGFLVGALTLVGKSAINNSGIDVVSFVINEMAKRIAWFLEKEMLNGTSGKATGALSSTNKLTAASSTAVTADELIDLQAKVITAYQAEAIWIMNPDTFSKIKKLKDGQNRYMLETNLSNGFPYMLLGKPVYVSDNMPAMAASAKTVLYGDMTGLAVNMREDIFIEVLREKYATQHAIGINAWLEFDSNVIDAQKLAVLEMKAGG